MTVPADAARRRIVEIFTAEEGPLLRRWSQVSGVPVDELRDLHQALRTALVGDTDLADVRGLLGELSRARARQGYTPSDTARVVFSLKEAVYEQVEADGQSDALRGFAWLSRLIDDLGLFTFETYSAAREKIIIDQAEQLLELSTPVVKLWEGIVAVPLVGTLDSARTQVVMEKLLQTLVDTGSEHAVIDITGVPAVDTEVAQHLLKTVVAARLMGAECVISGIRPQIAHTIVTLGIEFGDIVTKASLADALAYALSRSGVHLKGAATTRVAVRAERD
ncbi:STAS domain-containing protein [Microbispora cellulosiformans]|uniref:STAS domain-containing protein n=1 Tax=Microbispora cellulosiformans TaxID=2614688 RepID=A0A5J5KA73_9ACTN|nr:STAS domain-containing protein [Microbispora cellulosiformans]KAA9381941.1 STAS domain-containing protein [Microbispora cellulosiformans]